MDKEKQHPDTVDLVTVSTLCLILLGLSSQTPQRLTIQKILKDQRFFIQARHWQGFTSCSAKAISSTQRELGMFFLENEQLSSLSLQELRNYVQDDLEEVPCVVDEEKGL